MGCEKQVVAERTFVGLLEIRYQLHFHYDFVPAEDCSGSSKCVLSCTVHRLNALHYAELCAA